MEAESYFNRFDLIKETVGQYECNINRKSVQFTSFECIKPYYDSENGLHLKIGKNNNEILKLDHSLFGHINYNKNLTISEKMDEYIRKKSDYCAKILTKVYSIGYEIPSAVQSLTIPFLIQGRDSIVQFKSGTGKTLSFVLGTIYGFDIDDTHLQYVYITSSHEVAKQIHNLVKILVPDNAKVCLCIGNKVLSSNNNGGFKQQPLQRLNSKEERKQAMNAQIVIGTVGKVYDYMCGSDSNLSNFNTNCLKAIVLDEFDQLLSENNSKSSISMSTKYQIIDIFKDCILKSTQRIFFSATVTPELISNCENFMRIDNNIGAPDDPMDLYNPFLCLLDSDDYALNQIIQYYCEVSSKDDKKDVLESIYTTCNVAQSIIFCNSINEAEDLQEFLYNSKLNLESSLFHGKLNSTERDNIINDFSKLNKIRCLISTDVTSRGVDVQGINLVLNWDMPNDINTYIHRVGRSGRFGRKGVAINFVMVNNRINEMRKINEIQKISKNSNIYELPARLNNLL